MLILKRSKSSVHLCVTQNVLFRRCWRLDQETLASVPWTWTMLWEIWQAIFTWNQDRLCLWSTRNTLFYVQRHQLISILMQALKSGCQLTTRSLVCKVHHSRYNSFLNVKWCVWMNLFFQFYLPVWKRAYLLHA